MIVHQQAGKIVSFKHIINNSAMTFTRKLDASISVDNVSSFSTKHLSIGLCLLS